MAPAAHELRRVLNVGEPAGRIRALAMPWNGDWHIGWMALWSIPILGALGTVLWFALARGRHGARVEGSPERLLKWRYAKGELDRETYERMRKDLRK